MSNKTFRPWDVDQVWLLPPSVEELVPAGHLAHRKRPRCGGHRSRYRLRMQTVEPLFGQMKAARGFRQFLLRGAAKARREWDLICTAHDPREPDLKFRND